MHGKFGIIMPGIGRIINKAINHFASFANKNQKMDSNGLSKQVHEGLFNFFQFAIPGIKTENSMDVFKPVICYAVILLVSTTGFAQTKDSIPEKVIAYVSDKFPSTRAFNVEYSQVTPYKYSSKFLGTNLPESKVENLYQLKTSANINFIKKKKWVLGTLLTYRYISAEVENAGIQSGIDQNLKEDFHYHSESLNLTYFSTLFNKMAIYSSSVIVDGSEQHFERVKGMLTGTIVLKANAATKMTIGLVVFIDPSAQIPVLPIFSYEHKFKNGWIADVILPKGAFMRKNIFDNGKISIGSESDNTTFYLYNLDNTRKTYSFNQLEINSGVIYEHYLGGSFIATFKTGMKNVPTARIFEKSDSQDDYIFKAAPKASFYFNAGISFNPFSQRKK